MNIAWELFIDVLQVAIIYNFLIRYLGFRKEKKNHYGELFFWMTISSAAIAIPSLLIPLEITSTLLSVCFNYIFCVQMLNGTKKEKAFLSVFVMALVAISAIIGVSLVGLIGGKSTSHLLETFSIYRIALTLLAQILLLWFTCIALHWKTKANLTLSNCILLFFVPFFSIVALYFLWTLAFRDTNNTKIVVFITLLFGFIELLVYIFFRQISNDNRVKQEYQLLKLQYDCVQNTSYETRHMYEEMQSMRHDLKNHLYCIEQLAATHKDDEIQTYVQDLLQEQRQKDSLLVFTNNSVLDAILNTKIAIAKENGIQCVVFITYPMLPLSQNDICVLLGNLMDNAIEAAIHSEEKIIQIRIARQTEYAYICVQNSIVSSTLSENPNLQTSKSDKKSHGFGVRNIKKIVDQYHGEITFNEVQNNFICDVLIPLHTNLE